MSYRDEVLRTCPDVSEEPFKWKLCRGGLGVAGEAGEVADLIKKVAFHGVDIKDVAEELLLEMGDVYWYLEYLCAVLGVTSEEVRDENAEKLRKRYPEWFKKQDDKLHLNINADL